MARTRRRSDNRLRMEIDQGIQEYAAEAKERACRRKHGRLLELLTGEAREDGIFYRPGRPTAVPIGSVFSFRTAALPTLWS